MQSATHPMARLACTFAICAAASSAAAQTQTSTEVYGGYSYLRDPSSAVLEATADDNGLGIGWAAGAARAITPWLAAVGEASGHYKRRTTLDADITLSFHAFMGGARVSATVGRVTEFAQVLVGAVRARGSQFGLTASTTGFAVQPGGGIDYPLRSRLAVRLQLDYRTINSTAAGRLRAHQFRGVVALVYRR